MITSYEVGAILRVVDEASPALERMAAAAREFDVALAKAQESLTKLARTRLTGLTSRIDKLGASFVGVSDQSEATAMKIAANFANVDRSIATSADAVRALKLEVADLAKSYAAIPALPALPRLAPPGGGGGSGGAPPGIRARGSEGWGLGHTRLTSEGMHQSYSMPTTPLLAAGAALGYGIWLEGETEDQLARMILTGQMNSDAPMVGTPQFEQARKTLQEIVERTAFSPKEVGDAMLGVERQFGGLPFEKRIAIEGTIAPYAGAEARLKETSFKESFEALVGLTHMTGTYDPEKIPELMRQFSYASLITPASIPSLRNALSYSMPMLHAGLDMDPSSIMFLTAMMQTAGVTNSKSGTWLRSFFERASPPLDDTPASMKRLAALQDIGMVDEQRRPLWQVKDSAGKTDWDASILKLSEIINKWTQSTDPVHRIAELQAAFGERGGGFGALMNLPEFIKQFAVLQEKMKNFQGGTDVMGYLTGNSPMQQGRQAWADLQVALMDLGKTVMPQVIQTLKDLDTGIKTSEDQVIAFAGVLGGAISAVSGFGAALGGIVSRFFGLGGPQAPLGGAITPPPALLDPGALERSRRSQDEYMRDPEAARGRAMHNLSVPLQIKTSINLDGRVLAESMSTELARLSTFPTQAAYGDPYVGFAVPDYNTNTG